MDSVVGRRRALLEGRLKLPRQGLVAATGDAAVPFVVLAGSGEPVEAVSDWVRELLLGDASSRTARAYCHCLLTWFRVLWALGVAWERATEAETPVLVGWLRSAPNPQRRRRRGAPAAGSVNAVTGKSRPWEGYSRATINLTLAAVSGFYAFHARGGCGPVVNPVPASPARRRALAHRSSIEAMPTHRRARLRQKTVTAGPRSIPDGRWVELFAAVGCDRDRALLACFVSSGARTAELLGAVVGDVEWAGAADIGDGQGRVAAAGAGVAGGAVVAVALPRPAGWAGAGDAVVADAAGGAEAVVVCGVAAGAAAGE